MGLYPFILQQLFAPLYESSVKSLLLFGGTFNIEVVVDVEPPLLFESVTLVRPWLLILPCGTDGSGIEFVVGIVMLKGAKVVIERLKGCAYKGKRHLRRKQKLAMLSIEGIDIGLTVKAAIHYQLDLGKAQLIKIAQKMSYRLDIGHISRKLAVVKRQIGLCPKDHGQIEL